MDEPISARVAPPNGTLDLRPYPGLKGYCLKCATGVVTLPTKDAVRDFAAQHESHPRDLYWRRNS